jgi:hypothetical protein
MRVLAFFLVMMILSLSCDAFSPSWTTTTRATTKWTPLRMGGYYNEPGTPLDQSDTHMIFGVRCLETTITVKGLTIVALRPEEEGLLGDDDDDPVRAMVQYLQQEHDTIDLNGKTVVEVGASAVSLAACWALGASSVVVCPPDDQRLRIFEHAKAFLNPNHDSPSSCNLTVATLTNNLPLPPADVVFVTLSGNGDDDEDYSSVVLDRVREALDQNARVILPSALLLVRALSNNDYDFKEIADYGILDILPQKDTTLNKEQSSTGP